MLVSLEFERAVFSGTMRNQMESGIYSLFCCRGQQKNGPWILLVSSGTGQLKRKEGRGTGLPRLRGSFLTSPRLPSSCLRVFRAFQATHRSFRLAKSNLMRPSVSFLLRARNCLGIQRQIGSLPPQCLWGGQTVKQAITIEWDAGAVPGTRGARSQGA